MSRLFRSISEVEPVVDEDLLPLPINGDGKERSFVAIVGWLIDEILCCWIQRRPPLAYQAYGIQPVAD